MSLHLKGTQQPSFNLGLHPTLRMQHATAQSPPAGASFTPPSASVKAPSHCSTTEEQVVGRLTRLMKMNL